MFRKIELLLFILIVAGFIILNKNLREAATSENVTEAEYKVVLDAGHGGADPGKVGINNVLEKDINLQIANKVKAILEQKGIKVIMTRERDEMLGDGLESEKGQDMKARVDIINKENPDLAVSIHQNSYTDQEVSGAQVFYYSESAEGKEFAEKIQEKLLVFDEMNHRQAKANNNYYLLTRTKVPTVIVECGFLSNYEEYKKLSDQQYQEEISKVIVDGIESCFAN